MRIAVSLLALLLAVAPLAAMDTGLLKHPLNLDVKLPRIGGGEAGATTAEQAQEAARIHIDWVLRESPREGPMAAYWADYRQLLERWSEPSRALPVVIQTEDGAMVVARWLVGLRMNGPVGGFIAIDPKDGQVQSPLMWTPELKPLWLTPESEWNRAESVNEIAGLEELLAPFTQFTTGIPIDPAKARDQGFQFVDGVLDMPLKTQEERSIHVQLFNATHGTELNVALGEHRGRRTATSKCMSVACSYLADWWHVRTGGTLPSYTNGVGGQKEYGFNPRLFETLFFKRRADKGLLGKWLGDFKSAPFGKDRITGEPIPYSPRGYSRILVETEAGTWPDPLVPSLLQYETRDNPFGMDERPLVLQIFTEGLFPRKTVRSDLSHADDPDFPFQTPAEHGTPFDEARLIHALETWGPLLGQHMARKKNGMPNIGRYGNAVHAVEVVGWGQMEGRTHFVYRETFGTASATYLEDSFLGPSYRVMPLEYFYQAIAFPHRLMLQAVSGEGGSEFARFDVTVHTNRGRDAVDPDRFEVQVDGRVCEAANWKHEGPGRWRLLLPRGDVDGAESIVIRAARRYFADRLGRGGFGASLKQVEDRWIAHEATEPVEMDWK